MTKNDLNKLVGHKRHKFGAIRQVCNLAHNHPSRAEANHCWALQAQMKAGSISSMAWEIPYDLKVKGILVAVHKPDFSYFRPGNEKDNIDFLWHRDDGKLFIKCVDEVKGVKTPDWVIKSKLFQVLYPEIEYRVIG